MTLTPLWADAAEIERRYCEPDPERHDVPDLCVCTHEHEDHTRTDSGCAWRDCPCPWFDLDEPVDDDEPEHYDGSWS